jgi:hypothetical protein
MCNASWMQSYIWWPTPDIGDVMAILDSEQGFVTINGGSTRCRCAATVSAQPAAYGLATGDAAWRGIKPFELGQVSKELVDPEPMFQIAAGSCMRCGLTVLAKRRAAM